MAESIAFAGFGVSSDASCGRLVVTGVPLVSCALAERQYRSGSAAARRADGRYPAVGT
jgi:hypothetical protein